MTKNLPTSDEIAAAWLDRLVRAWITVPASLDYPRGARHYALLYRMHAGHSND